MLTLAENVEPPVRLDRSGTRQGVRACQIPGPHFAIFDNTYCTARSVVLHNWISAPLP